MEESESTRKPEHVFKLLIIGDSGVGKSSLLIRFADNTFTDNFVSTIGVDFKIRTVEVDGCRVRLQIWDTAGQERFRTITSTYYRGSHGVILVYDVTDRNSFNNVRRWLLEMDQNCEYVDMVLVGNKDDAPDEKQVPTLEASEFAQKIGVSLFETSAKLNVNVELMFLSLVSTILQTKRHRTHTELVCRSTKDQVITLTKWTKKKKAPFYKSCWKSFK